VSPDLGEGCVQWQQEGVEVAERLHSGAVAISQTLQGVARFQGDHPLGLEHKLNGLSQLRLNQTADATFSKGEAGGEQGAAK
jgi:hypothetical protein